MFWLIIYNIFKYRFWTNNPTDLYLIKFIQKENILFGIHVHITHFQSEENIGFYKKVFLFVFYVRYSSKTKFAVEQLSNQYKWIINPKWNLIGILRHVCYFNEILKFFRAAKIEKIVYFTDLLVLEHFVFKRIFCNSKIIFTQTFFFLYVPSFAREIVKL